MGLKCCYIQLVMQTLLVRTWNQTSCVCILAPFTCCVPSSELLNLSVYQFCPSVKENNNDINNRIYIRGLSRLNEFVEVKHENST